VLGSLGLIARPYRAQQLYDAGTLTEGLNRRTAAPRAKIEIYPARREKKC
jgi:hypothetical protein